MKKAHEPLITDEEIKEAFGDTHTSYDPEERRELLEKGVLDMLGGYRSGHTLTEVMIKMKLISKSGGVLKRGRMFLHETFRQ